MVKRFIEILITDITISYMGWK